MAAAASMCATWLTTTGIGLEVVAGLFLAYDLLRRHDPLPVHESVNDLFIRLVAILRSPQTAERERDLDAFEQECCSRAMGESAESSRASARDGRLRTWGKAGLALFVVGSLLQLVEPLKEIYGP